MKPIIAKTNEIAAASAEHTPSLHLALAGLSLSMLLSSLGTSITNVGLPALAQAFNATFQDVQWIVLAYLLSARLVRVQARMILFWFAAAYTILSAIIFFETFATEQDAGYQLQLLAIPMIGIPSLAFVTLAAIGANRR